MKGEFNINITNKKEELQKFHRNYIIKSAEKLFSEKGFEKTTMDDIAREADYSKATIYVYFKSKEEIYSYIVYNGMQMLKERMKKVLSERENPIECYFGLCHELANYQEEYPSYFDSTIKYINIDLELKETPKIYRDIYDIGEEMNELTSNLVHKAIKQGIVRNDIRLPQTSFLLWAGIAGIIQMAGQKEKYITRSMNITKEQFLKEGFQLLLYSVLTDEAKSNLE
jgi:AcrR family transcriptional regulator